MGCLRSSTSHRQFLAKEARRLTVLTNTARVPGGFGWLDESCQVSPEDIHLWISARMTHVAGLALLAQSGANSEPEPRDDHATDYEAIDFEAVVAHGVDALLDGPLCDHTSAGWLARAGSASGLDQDKQAYEHAFALLAACTAVAAGASRSNGLLQRAIDVFDEHFWDADAAMVVETWDRSFSVLSDWANTRSSPR